jgi:hypothetical protein
MMLEPMRADSGYGRSRKVLAHSNLALALKGVSAYLDTAEIRIPRSMSTYQARLTALRDELSRRSLDGFVIPLTDEHMSEYIGSYAQRLAWLTGFLGSAGSAVVLPEERAGLAHRVELSVGPRNQRRRLAEGACPPRRPHRL